MNYTKKVIRTAKRTDEFLESSISSHQARLESAIRDLESRIISDVKAFKTTDAGKLMGPRVNLKLAQKIHSRLSTLFDETYGDAVRQVTKGFKRAETFIKKSFKDLEIAADFTDVDNDVLKTLQKSTWNTFNQFGTQIQEQLVDAMYSGIVGGVTFSQLTDQFRSLLSGVRAKRGTMARYASLYAHDATMNFHTEVTMKKARDAGVRTFLYYGNLMNTSRQFCIDRVGKTFSKSEIESWNGLTWQGKSGPPLLNRGGYNCRHSWVAVLKAKVDENELNDKLGMKKKSKPKKKVRGAPTPATTTEQLKSEYDSARRKLREYTKKGAPGQGLRSWTNASQGYLKAIMDGHEPSAIAYQLHQEAFEAEMKWFRSLPAKEKEVQRARVLDSYMRNSKIRRAKSAAARRGLQTTQYDELERAFKRKLDSGTRHMSYRVLRELERSGVRVDWDFAHYGRPHYRDKVVHLFKDSDSIEISHEFAHSIDDFFGGGGRGALRGRSGLVWQNGGTYVGETERELIRKEFKDIAQDVAMYSNGDGAYYTGNWIDTYDARIYSSFPTSVTNKVLDAQRIEQSGIGQEFWAMNVQRFASSYRNADALYQRTVASIRKSLARVDSALEEAKSVAHPNSRLIKSLEERRKNTLLNGKKALRGGKDKFIREQLSLSTDWHKVHDFYPNTAKLIERVFLDVTADSATVTDPMLDIITGRREFDRAALELRRPAPEVVRMRLRAAPKLQAAASRLDPETNYVRIKGKWYYDGKRVTGKIEKDLNAMRLPPAWSNVVVSADPLSKVQAVGLDKAGRWQYRYSAKHIEEAARKKFMRIKSFSRDHDAIMNAVKRGVKEGDTRAILLDLEDKTAIRVGSDRDFKARVKAYGLTTLQKEHVAVKGNKIIFDFIAKEGKHAHYEIVDNTLAKWMKERLSTLKTGDQVFPEVNARQLNEYLRSLAGGKSYSIKDFRTFHGTRIALSELEKYAGKDLTEKEIKKVVKEVSTTVSDFLHNTPTMAKNSYIDPMVWETIGGI